MKDIFVRENIEDKEILAKTPKEIGIIHNKINIIESEDRNKKNN